jgi:hypothetical protein
MSRQVQYDTVDVSIPVNTSGSGQVQFTTNGSFEEITGVAVYKSTTGNITHINIGLSEVSGNVIQKPTHENDWVSTANLGHHERYKALKLEAKGKKYNIDYAIPTGQSINGSALVFQVVFRMERTKSC